MDYDALMNLTINFRHVRFFMAILHVKNFFQPINNHSSRVYSFARKSNIIKHVNFCSFFPEDWASYAVQSLSD